MSEAAEILAKEMQAIVAADRWKGRDLSAAPPEKWSHLRAETQQFWIDTASRILAAIQPADLVQDKDAEIARLRADLEAMTALKRSYAEMKDAAEAERDELRAAIFGGPNYSPRLQNGNFVEMVTSLHAAQQGGLARAEKAEAERGAAIRAKDCFQRMTRPKPVTYGPFKQEGSLDGVVISVGGADQTAHVQLQNGDLKYTGIETDRETARRLAKHMYEAVRVMGTGRWLRDATGAWLLKKFTMTSFVVLEPETLVSAVEKLRAIEGGEWGEMNDPVAALKALRDSSGGTPEAGPNLDHEDNPADLLYQRNPEYDTLDGYLWQWHAFHEGLTSMPPADLAAKIGGE